MRPTREYIRVYVWELPVRLFHWINALSILALAVTGYLIAHPPAFMSQQDASMGYWFAKVRFTHFVAAYIFLFVMIMRLYWAFVGNKFARWNNFIPYKPAQFKEMLDVLKIEILAFSKKPLHTLGHNVIAYISYAVMFFLGLFQIVSGFAIYAQMSSAWLPQQFTWVIPLFGNELTLLNLHYAVMWLFALFTVVHIYLVFFTDYIDGHGDASSIIGGWKFLDRHSHAVQTGEGFNALGHNPAKTSKARSDK